MPVDPSLYLYALGAGIVSFISPCNLGILPAFISYVISTSKSRKQSFLLSMIFAVGFAVTFAVIGIVFLMGVMSLQRRVVFNILAGSITVLLSLYLFFNKEIQQLATRLKRQKSISGQVLYRGDLEAGQGSGTAEITKEKDSPVSSTPEAGGRSEEIAMSPPRSRPSGYGGAFILGFSTGSSWIACVTPVFGTILAVGSVQGEYGTALYLMVLYGLGIMLPFIVLGTVLGEINTRVLAKLIRWGSAIERLFALFLLWIGIEILLSAYNLPGLLEAF